MHEMVETEKDELSLYKRLNTQIQSVHMCSKMSYEIEMVPLSRVSIILAHYLLRVKVRRPWPSTQEGKKIRRWEQTLKRARDVEMKASGTRENSNKCSSLFPGLIPSGLFIGVVRGGGNNVQTTPPNYPRLHRMYSHKAITDISRPVNTLQ
jgi:hypothetical protein